MKRTGFFLAAALIGVLLLAFLLQPKEESWTLPDGSKLRLTKVTWGTNHINRYGHRPIDLLQPLIPPSYRSNFNFQIARVFAPPPGSLMVWFKRSGIPTNASPQRGVTSNVASLARGSPPLATILMRGSMPFMVSVADDYGVESRTSSDVRVAIIDDSTEIVGVVLSSYPRRAKSFSARIHWSSPVRPASSGGSTTLLSEFRVANPGSKNNQPDWIPEPLPAAHRTNGLELTLSSLETGLTVADALQKHGWQSRPDSTMSDYWRRTYSRAAFVVRESGVAATNWSICRWALSDAAGEKHSLSISPTALLKPAEVVFPDSLWLDEPAWKLEVELARTTAFPNEELETIRGLPVPVEGLSVTTNLATRLNGTEIRIIGITRARGPGGAPPPTMSVSRTFPDQLVLNLQAPDSVRLTLIEARDDQGRSAVLENSVQRPVSTRGVASPGTLVWLFQFNFPADAKTADLKIAVSPRRNFEFYVKPTLATTNGSAAK